MRLASAECSHGVNAHRTCLSCTVLWCEPALNVSANQPEMWRAQNNGFRWVYRHYQLAFQQFPHGKNVTNDKSESN